MKILVTGALGYLGGRTVEFLAARGHVLRLGARSIPPSLAPWAGRFDRARLDVLDARDCTDAASGIDVVVHLAGLDEHEAASAPELALRTAREGTANLLAACDAAGTARLVLLSTFHVYAPTDAPIDERSPVGPRHPYAASRLAAEQICGDWTGPVGRTVLRLSNGYGAPIHPTIDRWTLAFNDFCRQANQSRRIVLKSSGAQQRDLVWIEDAAHAIELVATRAGAGMEVFNVGGGNSVSIYALAQRVQRVAQEVFGVAVPIDRPEGPSSAPTVEYRIERLRALGVAPRDAIDDETRRTLSLLRSFE